jgi:hypothetical protein
MAISEEKALELLQELLKRPELQDVAKTYRELLEVHMAFFPAAEPTPSPGEDFTLTEIAAPRRRARQKNPSAVHGWPKGVTQREYMEWKARKLNEGYTGTLHPAIYKAERDGTPMPDIATPRDKRRSELRALREKLAQVEAPDADFKEEHLTLS